MAVYTVAAGQLAVHNKTLAANIVDAINFDVDPSAVEIQTDGAAAIYVTTDGSTPTVGGANTHLIPAIAGSRFIRHGGDRGLRLISAGTPTYSVTKISAQDIGDSALSARIDALADSLESGDAWDGAATGRVLTSGTPPTWEESSGGGGASNAGDRARLESDTFDSVTTFAYVLAFNDPQPEGAALPSGWTITDGGLVLPAGVYWVAAIVSATATESGTFGFEINFDAEWNAADAWAVGGGSPSQGGGGGKSDSTVDVVADDNPSAFAKGIVATATSDALRVFPSGALFTATSPSVDLFVTRIA